MFAMKAVYVAPAAGLFVTLAACGGAPSGTPGLVDVGGRPLYLTCLGEGSPTVVLEGGGMGNSASWSSVQPEIAKFTRVCAYDRAGEGHSSSVPAHDNFQAIARDLQALLDAGGVPGSYVVMGHSFGGRLIPYFADLYATEVVGMVLLDPGHEEFTASAEAALAPEAWQQYLEAGGRRIARFEEAQGPASLGAPGDFPLVVISAANVIDRPGVPYEVNVQLYDLLVGLHREMVALSPDGTHIVAEGSGHGIQNDRPDLVVATVEGVVEQARTKGKP
jgi:pimeloyl-ACP methyl ester carboxylesterase